MVKGVYKNIIEISNTGSEYFDRAILFVRPAQLDRDDDHLRRKGQEYLWGLKLRPWLTRRRWLDTLLKVGMGAAAGAGIATAALLLV